MRSSVSVERVVPAPPERVFALLADPSRHAELDGSGTVVGSPRRREPLRLGDSFVTRMRAGLPYAMRNTVVELEPDRVIAWQPRPAYPVLDRLIGGRVWRYELRPVDGGTLVRETWDVSAEAALSRVVVARGAGLARTAMERSLERLGEVLRRDAG